MASAVPGYSTDRSCFRRIYQVEDVVEFLHDADSDNENVGGLGDTSGDEEGTSEPMEEADNDNNNDSDFACDVQSMFCSEFYVFLKNIKPTKSCFYLITSKTSIC